MFTRLGPYCSRSIGINTCLQYRHDSMPKVRSNVSRIGDYAGRYYTLLMYHIHSF